MHLAAVKIDHRVGEELEHPLAEHGGIEQVVLRGQSPDRQLNIRRLSLIVGTLSNPQILARLSNVRTAVRLNAGYHEEYFEP